MKKIEDKDIDKQNTLIFRSIACVLIVISVVYLFISQADSKWLHSLLIWILFAAGVNIYRYYLYRKGYKNFCLIQKEMEGRIKKGSYVFFVPHCIKFTYSGRLCQIGHSVDWKFDHFIEFSYLTNKEIELVAIRKNKSRGPDLGDRFIISGADKNAFDLLANDSQMKAIFESLMQDFSYLTIGKDCQIRLFGPYDSYLTKPEVAIPVFAKMILLVDFLEAKLGK